MYLHAYFLRLVCFGKIDRFLCLRSFPRLYTKIIHQKLNESKPKLKENIGINKIFGHKIYFGNANYANSLGENV